MCYMLYVICVFVFVFVCVTTHTTPIYTPELIAHYSLTCITIIDTIIPTNYTYTYTYTPEHTHLHIHIHIYDAY
jgi:hypothetical protein